VRGGDGLNGLGGCSDAYGRRSSGVPGQDWEMMKLDGGNARSQGLIAMRRRNGACYYSALFLQIHFIFPFDYH
jgi:hypothetical protein